MREQLIIDNMPLARSISKSYANNGIDLDDLIQEGYLGLTKAADRFDPTMNSLFRTYAKYWIIESITDAFKNRKALIRIPVNTNRQIILFNKGKLSVLPKKAQDALRCRNIDVLNTRLYLQLVRTEQIDIETILLDLPFDLREIIERRFGLKDYLPQTFSTIGIQMNISREWARQQYNEAIKILREGQ